MKFCLLILVFLGTMPLASAEPNSCTERVGGLKLIGKENWPTMTAPSLPKIPTEIFQNAEDRFEFETHGAPFKAVRKDLVANGSIIVPPKPQYPPDLIEEGAEAYCEVRFDVQPEGKTENVVAACTDKRFIAEAVRAIEVWKAPAIRFRAGYAITAHNVIYPIQFCRSYDNAVEGGS